MQLLIFQQQVYFQLILDIGFISLFLLAVLIGFRCLDCNTKSHVVKQ